MGRDRPVSAPASREIIEPAQVGSRLRRAVGPGKLRVRAITRHAVRVSVALSAARTGASQELLRQAAEALRASGYRVTESTHGVFQASSGFIPTLVVGYQLWEEDAGHE